MRRRFKPFCGIVICIITVLFSLSPVLADENTMITMDFKGADLRDVFRTLAQIAEVNVITHQSVQGEVTLSLKEVPFKEAIDLITLINDLRYRWVGNTLLIARQTEIDKNFKETVMQAYAIQYAPLDKTKEILEALLTGSKVTIDDRTRTLIITAEKAQLLKAEEIIKRLDTPIKQVFLDVRVEEISTTEFDKLGVPLGSYTKLKFITGSKGFITDLTLEIPTVVEALEKDGVGRTLANPGLVTLDGQTAKLLIGDKIPVEAQEIIDGKTRNTIKYIEAGISLEFRPQISEDGYITLNVKPQVSSLGEYLTQGYPIIKTRELETVVRIKDGQTFVIGGLIRDDDRVTAEKVPLLNKIPILGALFKHDEKTKQATEILIFITPRIISPDEPVATEEKWLNISEELRPKQEQ